MGITIRSGTSLVEIFIFQTEQVNVDEYRGYVQYNHSSNYLTIAQTPRRLRIDRTGQVILNNSEHGDGTVLRITAYKWSSVIEMGDTADTDIGQIVLPK